MLPQQPTVFPFLGEPASALANDVCYFCGNVDGKLHEVTSFHLNRCVRRSAYILTETEQTLIEKLSKEDMIAQEAKYRATCLGDLHCRADRFQLGSSYSDDKKQKHSLAFVSVISFIYFADSEEKKVIFNLLSCTPGVCKS